MAPKKKSSGKPKKRLTEADLHANIMGAGMVMEQPITETLETNYMPYAMSVILSRAIPEIDGFKPAHRKLLYTMYTMNLLNGNRTKSANIVGQTMRLNPHGDMAIYDTLVRMTRGNQTLLHPYVDSKGNFGKAYSRDMQAAAARYTEAKLDSIATELFRDIGKDTVDFVDNYDATMKEPTLFPVTFPTVLVNANTGIAVGMASNICSFNLTEVCETTIAYMRDEQCDLHETLKAPDFSGGGYIVYRKEELDKVYETGRGGFKVRARYQFDPSANCIDITEIPPTTSCEQIIEKIIDLVKQKKITEINDIRDETGLDGMKLTIDLKRGVDADKLMLRLYKTTPLEDTFSCNFNVLIAGSPRVMGVRELLGEWVAFRMECVRRRVYYDMQKAKDKLHLLQGLAKILLDIDKAVAIIRGTESEGEVIPNLMIGFGIDEIQANYVAEIKLRHLNREYILNRTAEIEELEREVGELEATLNSQSKIKGVIVSELKSVIKKHGVPRKSELYFPTGQEEEVLQEKVADYPVFAFLTREGYFKKITPQSLRMSSEHKLKEGDEITQTVETSNVKEILFFSDRCQVYKAALADFSDTKASVLGDYIPAKLGFDEGEGVAYMAVTDKYDGYMLFFFENGKVAKVEMKSYYTKTNRRKLLAAYSDKCPLAGAAYAREEGEYLLTSTNGRMLLVHSGALTAKTTRSTQGVAVMTQRKGHRLASAVPYTEGTLNKEHRYRARNLPAAGSLPLAEDAGEQMTL